MLMWDMYETDPTLQFENLEEISPMGTPRCRLVDDNEMEIG
jgi:hypothetical protein